MTQTIDVGFGPRHTEGTNNLSCSFFSLSWGLSVLSCPWRVCCCVTPLAAGAGSSSGSPAERRELGQRCLQAEGAAGRSVPQEKGGAEDGNPLRRSSIHLEEGILGGCPAPPAVPLDGSIGYGLDRRPRAGLRFSLVKHQPGKRLIAMQMYL